jgi:two-component system sensor histidine kinase AlgZ
MRQLPEALVRAVLFGVVVGLPLSFVFTSVGTWRFFWLNPWDWFVRASAIGVTFSVSFYVACGLPVSYLLQSPRRSRLFIGATAIVGGALGSVTALLVFAIMRGSLTPDLTKLAIADGILAMILTVTLTRWSTLRAEKELAEARARSWALQAQINPHFFFNTLNTIAALIKPNPDAAERTIGLLADMSRYAFATSEAEIVPLERELEFARTYLQIEKARFGDRLWWELPETKVVEGLTLPALILQPLIENAIRHGIAKRMAGGGVTVRVERAAEQFTLTVANQTDAAVDAATFLRPGHALSNIRERLRLTYGDRASLELSSKEPDMVSAVIKAPVDV